MLIKSGAVERLILCRIQPISVHTHTPHTHVGQWIHLYRSLARKEKQQRLCILLMRPRLGATFDFFLQLNFLVAFVVVVTVCCCCCCCCGTGNCNFLLFRGHFGPLQSSEFSTKSKVETVPNYFPRQHGLIHLSLVTHTRTDINTYTHTAALAHTVRGRRTVQTLFAVSQQPLRN